MMNLRGLALGLFLVAIRVTPVSAASFTFTDINLGTAAYGDSEFDLDGAVSPTSPYVDTHHSERGLSTATAIYDLEWGDHTARFDFLFDQVIQDIPTLTLSEVTGTIVFTTTSELLLEYDLSYSFNNLNQSIILTSTLDVVRTTPSPSTWLLHSVEREGAGTFGDVSGSFHTPGQMLLGAGERYRIAYRIQFVAGDGAGAIGAGSGSFHFTLNAVPEPATLLLLAFAGVAILRHRRASITSDPRNQDAPSPSSL